MTKSIWKNPRKIHSQYPKSSQFHKNHISDLDINVCLFSNLNYVSNASTCCVRNAGQANFLKKISANSAIINCVVNALPRYGRKKIKNKRSVSVDMQYLWKIQKISILLTANVDNASMIMPLQRDLMADLEAIPNRNVKDTNRKIKYLINEFWQMILNNCNWSIIYLTISLNLNWAPWKNILADNPSIEEIFTDDNATITLIKILIGDADMLNRHNITVEWVFVAFNRFVNISDYFLVEFILMDLVFFRHQIGDLWILYEFVVIDLFFHGDSEEMFGDFLIDFFKGALIPWFELVDVCEYYSF